LIRKKFALTLASVTQALVQFKYTHKADFLPTFYASSGFPGSVCTVKVRPVEKTETIVTNDTCMLWIRAVQPETEPRQFWMVGAGAKTFRLRSRSL